MANDTIPMADMFDACDAVLEHRLRPIHYAELTELALESLGAGRQMVNWQRQIEDVREKMLIAGQRGAFYVPQPHCLAAKRYWFVRPLFNIDTIRIPGHAEDGANGAFEALMRDPYMQIKTAAAIERVKRARANGLVLEHHVAGWFSRQWPMFYQEPDNYGQWNRPCNHDFKLGIGNSVFEVDVSGPDANGRYVNPGHGKRSADLHLLCRIDGRSVLWQAAVTGARYLGQLSPEAEFSPKQLVVWLNCMRDGIPYQVLREYAQNGAVA